MARPNATAEVRRAVFVDTGGWLALANRRDKYAAQARAVYGQLRQKRRLLITTSYVVNETVSGLIGKISRAKIVDLIERIHASSSAIEVVFVTPELERRGWALFKSRPDKTWSLTDCISFAVMQERGYSDVFTPDEHFLQAGFVCLLNPNLEG